MTPGMPAPLAISLFISYLGFTLLCYTTVRMHGDRARIKDSVMLAQYLTMACGVVSLTIRSVYFATH